MLRAMLLGSGTGQNGGSSKWRRAGLLATMVLVVAAIGWVDYVTGPDIGMSLFYLVPVSVAGWCVGRRGALLVASTASGAWFVADLLTRADMSYALSTWNGGTRMFMYTALGVLLARVRDDQRTLRELLERERALARTDALTGLGNQRSFVGAMETEFARAKREGCTLGLMYLDVDNFKRINDGFGHAAGDEVLVAIAATIRKAVRAGDVVARIGGDEFAVLLWNVEPPAGERLAQRVIDEVAQLGGSYPGSDLGMSAGLVLVSGPSQTVKDAMARADALMYAGKREGKGRVLTEEQLPSK